MKFYFLIIMLIITPRIMAKDFGQRGPVYPIIEVNFLDFIYQKLKYNQATGKLDELKQELQQKVEIAAQRPKGINLAPALRTIVRKYDPSLTLTKDIRNHEGALIAGKGTIVNPLAYISLSKQLIFINSDNKAELRFAKAKLNENYNNKIILVNGNVKDANQVLGVPVYFDQNASLINRFNLEHTPSVIEQDGRYLKITEVAL